MPRDYANIQVSIWGNPDVRALPPMHQWLYLQLWTHPDLSYSGVLDWRPGKNIAPLSAGTTAADITALVPLLQERRFVVLDEDTEEILLRSYFRHDGLLKQRNLAVSMVNAYSATGSNPIRAAIILELQRLRNEFPDWSAWTSPKVLDILKHPAADPAVEPRLDPSAEGRADPQPKGRVGGHPTDTATSTDTKASLSVTDGESRLKETRLPKEWTPTASHFTMAAERSINIGSEAEAFRLHAETHDRHAARWNAAFTTWLKKSKPSTASRPKNPDAWMNL